MDRRDFLQTAGGVAAVLAVTNLAACSSSRRLDGSGSATTRSPSSTSSTTTSRPGGSFTVPPTPEVEACEQALGGNGQFVVDVHTHHVMPDGPWPERARHGAARARHGARLRRPNQLECADRAAYLHDLFLASDTTVAMLSDVPNSGPDDAPVPFADQLGTQQFAATAHARRRAARARAQRDRTELRRSATRGSTRWRRPRRPARSPRSRSTPRGVPNGQGYALDDPAIGLPVVQKAHDLGVKILLAHKGLPLVSFDAAHNRPDDMVAVSRQFPDMQFVVFHGAWDKNHTEGAYDPNATRRHRHVPRARSTSTTCRRTATCGSTSGRCGARCCATRRGRAHAGQAPARSGERVLWGTDAVWYGSPQAQILAFRAFQISRMSRALRLSRAHRRGEAQVLGLNAARLFHLDPDATRSRSRAIRSPGQRSPPSPGCTPTVSSPLRGSHEARRRVTMLKNITRNARHPLVAGLTTPTTRVSLTRTATPATIAAARQPTRSADADAIDRQRLPRPGRARVRDRVAVVDEPDRPAASSGALTWRDSRHAPPRPRASTRSA